MPIRLSSTFSTLRVTSNAQSATDSSCGEQNERSRWVIGTSSIRPSDVSANLLPSSTFEGRDKLYEGQDFFDVIKRRKTDALRIAMVGTRGMPANYGGVETVVDVLARQLVARGHEVTVFCRSEDYEQHPPMLDGVKLVYLPAAKSPGIGAMVHALRAAIYCVGRDYDVIHFHALGPGMMSLVSRLLTRSTVVVTVHGRDDKRDKWGRWTRMLLRFAAVISARVPHSTLVVSHTLANEYADEFGRSTTVVPNSTHPIPEVEPGASLERFGLEPQRYFLSVGRLVPEKAPHETIQAYNAAMTDMPLVIVGGAAGTERYVEHLHDLAAGNPNIIFTGPLYGDEMAEILTNAGAFVTSSHLEGLPTALIEAGRAARQLLRATSRLIARSSTR